MTTGGWTLMVGSLTFVWGLAGWCYYKILTAPDGRAEGTSATRRPHA